MQLATVHQVLCSQLWKEVMASQKSLPKCIMLISALPPAIQTEGGVEPFCFAYPLFRQLICYMFGQLF